MYFLTFEHPFAYSHYIEIIQSILDPSCKYNSFELTEKEGRKRNQTIIMLMMFSALREDLLPASRAVGVRIWSVIPTIQL